MAAFDRIHCGFEAIDEILDNIRLGDNVVWQVSDLDEFSLFAEPYIRQAVEEERKVIYVRFAHHKPVIQNLDGVQVFEINADIGFEAFTVEIYNEITK